MNMIISEDEIAAEIKKQLGDYKLDKHNKYLFMVMEIARAIGRTKGYSFDELCPSMDKCRVPVIPKYNLDIRMGDKYHKIVFEYGMEFKNVVSLLEEELENASVQLTMRQL